MYSSIVKKKCKGNCGRYPAMSMNGYCHVCAPAEIKEKLQSKHKEAQKRKNERLRISAKLRSLPENADMVSDKDKLEEFFRVAAFELSLNPVCQECSEFIPFVFSTVRNGKRVMVDNYRNVTAHIMFKAIFPSVAANINNRLFLCTKNGCHEKSHRLDTFSKMKIFPEAIRKFKLFEDQITEKHKLLDTFREYANKNLNK
jgi:hypothetical protein